MKKLLFLIVLFLLTLRLISQSLNSATHKNSDNAGNIVSINSGSYYWERSIVGCCGDELNVVGLNSSGAVVWKKNFKKGEHNIPVKLIKTKDNQLAFLFYSRSCDYGSDTYYLTKLDVNGNSIFQTTVMSLVDIVSYIDMSFFAVSGTDLIQYSKNGQLISDDDAGITNINSISLLNDSNFLINGKVNSVLKNIEITPTNSIVNQQNSSSVITKFVQSSTGFLFGKTTSFFVEKYNSTLAYISVAAVSANDFELRNDSLLLAGNGPNSQTITYNIMDLNFNTLYQSILSCKYVWPQSISINDQNRINIITRGSSPGSSYMSFTSLYQLPLLGNLNSNADVGVQSFTVNSAYIKSVNGPISVGIANLNVTVRNFGSVTVNNFYLNHYVNYPDCYNSLHKLCTNTILPGDSVVISNVTFYAGDFYVINDSVSPSKNYNICLFTTVPNSSNDINGDNDNKCQSTPFTLTGLDENTLSNESIKMYPNPFDESLNIYSETENGILRLYNYTGALISEETFHIKQNSFEESELPSGIYFLKIETEKGITTKKIIKQ